MSSAVSIKKAALYEKYRLPYAREAADGLLEQIGEVRVIADIGAGTGQLSRLFANRSTKIYAVEPDHGMREVASESLCSFGRIEILAGFAEHLPFADGSIDLLVIGNAFHRFKPEACEDLRRILKNQGWIALFTYEFKNKDYTALLASKLATVKSMRDRLESSSHNTPIHDLFGTAQVHTLGYIQSYSEDWTAFWGAACAGIEAPEDNEPAFTQFEGVMREVFETFAHNDRINISYETQVAYGQPLFG
jgi:ubiquinone/menaquinone biosynthesis C-methylase UbiE